jgi:hypothetical protein
MRIRPLMLSLSVLMVAASTGAGAQNAAPDPALRAACQGDVQRLCPGVGRLGKC